jgi:hypothetical protein
VAIQPRVLALERETVKTSVDVSIPAREFASGESLLESVAGFCETRLGPQAALIDQRDAIPDAIVAALVSMRLFALERLGGSAPRLEPSERLQLIAAVLEKLGGCSPPVAKLVLDHNFGQVSMIAALAQTGVRETYLDLIRRGAAQVAFLMTEPAGGSDSQRWACAASEVEGGFELSGVKDWITGADVRRVFLVVARTRHGFGLFLVDRLSNYHAPETLLLSHQKAKLGMRGLHEFRVTLDRVFVPSHHVVLAPNPSGLKRIMAFYNVKRAGEAAVAIGIAKSALEYGYRYASRRLVAATRDARYAMRAACTDSYIRVFLAEQAVAKALAVSASGELTTIAACIAKLTATEAAVLVTNQSLQLCGAAGTSSELPLERLMRDARMLTIAGGASEVLTATVGRRLDSLLDTGNHPLSV